MDGDRGEKDQDIKEERDVKKDVRKDHLELTAHQFREPGAVSATVTEMEQLSGTVKGLTLKVEDENGNLSFHPGQWLDFFIPGVEKVGGFSMYSSPQTLERLGTLGLAVKVSTWPPAHWVHTQCKVGDRVAFRFGGDFFYPSLGLPEPHSLLLVAGGVGINPLFSIWLQARHLVQTAADTSPVKVQLVYSAATKEERIFSESLDQTVSESKVFSTTYLVTKEGEEGCTGRVTKEHLREALETQHRDGVRTICYLCGPPEMTSQVSTWLGELGVAGEDVRYELWW